MNKTVFNGLKRSYTAYHAVEYAKKYLMANGFTPLHEEQDWEVERGGKYFVERGGSAIIAFSVGALNEYDYKIVTSHLDSPALKLKANPVMDSAGVKKLNVETYGGGIWSTFTDVPLKIAGRIVVKRDDRVESVVYTDDHNVVIPNVAIHMNRKINDGFVYNAQTDLCPLFSMSAGNEFFKNIDGEEVLGYDLYVVHDAVPFFAGTNDEFICSPRLDNLVCAFASLDAIVNSTTDGINVAFLADSEEIGSRTPEGADSDFLQKTVKRINKSLGYDCVALDKALARSFLVSADNAHAVHPNHPELSDPTNKVLMGGGVVIKYHANRNYTTDALSSALFKQIAKDADVKTQDFYMRSDLRCGSTLGAISSSHLSVRSVDIGAPQLAMHSAVETMCVSDVNEMVKALIAFYNATYTFRNGGYDL